MTEVQMKATRDGFGEALLSLGEKQNKVMVVCADLEESMRVEEFGKRFPERMVEVGVAEQNMVGLAAGLALEGNCVFAVSYAAFSPGRSWDQIRVSVALSNLNVKIVGGHTGLGVGPDGATHQALEDIAIMRVLPGMMVVVPADAYQARQATERLSELYGPAYLRLTRQKTGLFVDKALKFEIGKAQILRQGKDITVVGCGPILGEAMKVAEKLAGRVSVEVINMHTVKPIDAETLIRSAKKTGRVLCIEDHQVTGGLGGAVAEVLSEKMPVRLERMGVADKWGESGLPEDLYEKFGLSARWIEGRVEKLML